MFIMKKILFKFVGISDENITKWNIIPEHNLFGGAGGGEKAHSNVIYFFSYVQLANI